MLFIILCILSLFAAYGIGFSIEANVFACFLVGLALHILFAFITIIFCFFVSMLLGKTNQTHLKKISRLDIVSEDEHNYFLDNGFSVPKNLINAIAYDTHRPYIEVRRYNISRWKAVVFWELYDDRCEYILHSYT